jgi:hypothetical protein
MAFCEHHLKQNNESRSGGRRAYWYEGKNSSAIVVEFHARSTEATECSQQLWRYRPDADTKQSAIAIHHVLALLSHS